MTKSSKILYFIILSVFIFQIIKFYSFYSEYSSWQYVEWLINYQGGFVRRGFIGEILFQLNNFLKIDILHLVFFLNLITILIYFFWWYV